MNVEIKDLSLNNYSPLKSPLSQLHENSELSHSNSPALGSRKSARIAHLIDASYHLVLNHLSNLLNLRKNKKKKQYKTNKPKQKMTFKWSNNFKFPVDIPPNTFVKKPDIIYSPIEYFLMLFKPELLNLIVENTNLYGNQKSLPIKTDVNEIKNFIGI